MRDLIVHCNHGVGGALFGMSPNEVEKCMGRAEERETRRGGATIAISELRDGISYYYEDNKLVCITGPIEPPRFILDGERMPYTLISAVEFLKSKSKYTMYVENIVGYIFLDLGIVLYPFVFHDMPAGIKVTNHCIRISFCNQTILKRYYNLFLSEREKKARNNGETLELLKDLIKEYGNSPIDEEKINEYELAVGELIESLRIEVQAPELVRADEFTLQRMRKMLQDYLENRNDSKKDDVVND